MAGGRRIHRESAVARLHDCQLCIRGFQSEANLTKHLLKHAQNCQRKVQVVQWELSGTTEIFTEFVLTSFVRNKSEKFSNRLKSNRLKSIRLRSNRLKSTRLKSSLETINEDSSVDLSPTVDHSPGKIYECIFCKLIFSTLDELGNHMDEHPMEISYKCTVCGYYFRTDKDLSKHVVMHNREERYRCQQCGKGFVEKSQLTEHGKLHTSQWSHICNICERGFDDLIALARHVRSHTGEKSYRCYICDQSFKTPLRLIDHSYKHTGNWPYMCEVCGKGFTREAHKVSHISVHVDTENKKSFKCKFCEESFDERGTLLKHQKDHTEERYHCLICKQSYSAEATLRYHMKSHAGQDRFRCYHCGKGFRTKYYLQRHLPFHERRKRKPVRYECTICNKRFLSNKELQRHTKLHDKPYQCKICKSGRSSKRALINHMRERHYEDLFQREEALKSVPNTNTQSDSQVKEAVDESEIMPKLLTCYECSICSKVYLERSSCEKHLETHNVNSIVCNFCSISFMTETERLDHMDTTHSQFTSQDSHSIGSDTNNYQATTASVIVLHAGTVIQKHLRACNICGQTFKNKISLLVEHLKKHETEADWPPKCDICGQIFSSRKKLPAHRATHTNEWPFTCDQCGRGFYFKSKFLRHRVIHTDEKAFKCDVCNKAFHQKPDLKKHMMKHTDLRPFQCDQCGRTFRERGHMRRHIETQHGGGGSSTAKSHSNQPKRVRATQIQSDKLFLDVDPQMTPSGKIFYPCRVCLDAFTTKASYVKHMKSHSSDEQPLTAMAQQFHI